MIGKVDIRESRDHIIAAILSAPGHD
jgi:hypothetical protein